MLPKGDDADRAAEELDGWAIDLTAAERIDLAGQLLLQAAELSEEIEQRVARTAKPQLTRREMEILQLLAQGWTSAEIATKVLLQPGTVSVYIQVLQRKLGLSDPAQLPLWALRRGIGI
jgi:DNA-binding NarL/FixJ family response regulator